MKNVIGMNESEFYAYLCDIKRRYDVIKSPPAQQPPEHNWPQFDAHAVTFHQISREDYLRAAGEAPRIWGATGNAHFLKSVVHIIRTCTVKQAKRVSYSAYWNIEGFGYFTADRHLTIHEFQQITTNDVLQGEWVFAPKHRV